MNCQIHHTELASKGHMRCFVCDQLLYAPFHHNNPRFGDERVKSKQLSLKESNQAIKALNEAVNKMSDEDILLIQRFIYEYENLRYHATSLEGMWAVEDPDQILGDNKWKIKF